MRRSAALAVIAAIAAVAACGFDGIGTGAGAPFEPASDAASIPGDPAGPAGSEDKAPPPASGGEVPLENAPADAGGVTPYDAGALPTNPGSPLAYVVSGRFWSFNPVSRQWGGGTQLPSGGCPGLEDLALDAFGVLYATGGSGNNLYRVTPSPLSCTKIGAGGSGYPKSLAFAPRGTVNPYDEELVGYRDNGDWVRVDRTTGALVLLTTGAMAGRTVGDIVNVGAKGYAVARGGAGCGGDCIWEISLATGVPTTTAPIGTLPVTRQVNGLAHWGGKLYSFGNPDEVYVFDPTNPGGATKVSGPSGYVSVGYAGAATRTIAPMVP